MLLDSDATCDIYVRPAKTWLFVPGDTCWDAWTSLVLVDACDRAAHELVVAFEDVAWRPNGSPSGIEKAVNKQWLVDQGLLKVSKAVRLYRYHEDLRMLQMYARFRAKIRSRTKPG